jgi:hypothetical protein
MNRLWNNSLGPVYRVLDDFGMQGEPRKPGLLDWLACEFMSSGGT